MSGQTYSVEQIIMKLWQATSSSLALQLASFSKDVNCFDIIRWIYGN